MQFSIFATLVFAAAASAVTLDARQACVQPAACSVSLTTTVDGDERIIPISAQACCAGTTCGAPTPETVTIAGQDVEFDMAVSTLGGIYELLQLLMNLSGLRLKRYGAANRVSTGTVLELNGLLYGCDVIKRNGMKTCLLLPREQCLETSGYHDSTQYP